MANLYRQITLTSKSVNSGPLYDIYYSDDCINYTICVDGSSVSLPNIGSTAIVTMPDTATCIKLVNLSVGCFLNEVIQYLVCECYETITLNVTASGTVTYRNCFGTPQSESVTPGLVTVGTFGTGCINATTLGGTAIYSIDAFGICCVPVSTTTTTTSTSTTTTQAPTTTTTQPPTTTTTTFSNNPCICTEVNITSEGGEVATLNCYGENQNYVYLTAGTRYLCAAEIGGLLQASIVSGTGTVTPVGNCKTQPCPPATTTSTTTTIAPTTTTTSTTSTTTTTAAPTTTTTTYITTYKVEPCGGGAGPFIVTLASGDTPSGIGQAYKISGNTPAGFNGVTCWEVLEIDPVGTIDYNNLAFGAVFSNCAACNATTTTTTTAAPTTTTTSTTSTTTSTTTTTAAPTTTTTTYITTYKVEPCGGGAGPFIVTLGSGTTPSGIGQAFKISGNSGAGFNGITCWEVLEIDPVGTIDYTNLAFGSVFSNCAACNTTTTTTTTAAPTTTTTSTSTTTQAPTTTTTTECECVNFVNIEVTTAGNVTYLDCFNDSQIQNVGIGPEVIGAPPTCVQRNTLSGTADFTITEYGACCTASTTTTTTSTTSTTTSTTSTTTSTTSTTTTAPTTTTTTTGAPEEYQIDNGASGDSASACSGATTTSIVYAQPGYTVPFVGMILYTNIGLTTPFVGSSGWRKLTGPLDTYAVEIDTNGEITNYVTC